jgi:mono/diheme cytochrome c family protein
MRIAKQHWIALGVCLGAAAVLQAAPIGTAPPTAVEVRAHAGDGDLDAPVPPVGEPGGPSRPLDAVELAQWKRGRAIFDKNFHRSEGCGAPEMNADSCRACHQDPAIGGAGPLELNVSRFGNDNGGMGPFTDLPGGQGLSKLRPPFAEGREEYDPMTADVFEQRQTPTLFGAGLIDSIPEASILANEDPTDADMDGVFGVARMVDAGSGPEVGRFGWKAQAPRLADFGRDAMANEMGMTTPDDGRGFALLADMDLVPDPEVPQSDLTDLNFFLSNLAPPKPGGSTDPRRAQGELLFDTTGCATCHVPSLAGAAGPVPLFSDLLLHDVHPPTFRGMAEPGAPSGFYRTPPLWGNRATAPYMHDGRAETVEAAILNHFGEANGARLNYIALTPLEREALLLFLGDI